MVPYSPNTEEKPTLFAELTILELPSPPVDPAGDERPTRFAELRIEVVPLAPGAVMAGIAPRGEPEPAV
jgi:hypothetical protein